ncbi:MAG: TolC family protein [Gammaproteobacteria bacterium]|nr:TolC family protein [Gammaproteobacteria bacterium]
MNNRFHPRWHSLLLLLLTASALQAAELLPQRYRVITGELAVHALPRQNAAVIATLSRHAEVTVYEDVYGWKRISAAEDETAQWVSSVYLQRLAAAEALSDTPTTDTTMRAANDAPNDNAAARSQPPPDPEPAALQPPEITPPDLTTPDFSAASVAPESSPLPPTLDGLTSALKAVLQYHPAIAGKRAEIAAKGFDLATAESRRYATVSTQLGIDHDSNSQGILRLQQPLWAFGKIDRPIATATAEQLAAIADLQRIEQDLLQQTATAFIAIAGVRGKLRVSHDNMTTLTQLYERIERRYQGQLASEADVQLAQTRLLQAQAQEQQLQDELQIALQELKALTHIATESSAPLLRTALEPLDQPMSQSDTLLAQSATLRYKEALLRIAEAENAESAVSHLPTLLLQLDQALLDSSDSGDSDTRTMLLLEGSLDGLGFAARSRHSATASRITAASEDLRQSREDLQRQWAVLQQRLRLQQRLNQSHREAINNLQAINDSYVRQYEAGRKSWLEVLNIHKELSDQRLQWVESDNALLRAALQLLGLGEGLWQLTLN